MMMPVATDSEAGSRTARLTALVHCLLDCRQLFFVKKDEFAARADVADDLVGDDLVHLGAVARATVLLLVVGAVLALAVATIWASATTVRCGFR